MIPVALVTGGRLLRIEWAPDADTARVLALNWLNGARVAFARPAAYPLARQPAVYLPTLDGLDDAPASVREQIEAALEAT